MQAAVPALPVQRCGQPGCACEAEEAGALPVQREDGQYGPCAHTSCPSPEQIGLPTRPPADAPPECGDPWKRKCYEGADNDVYELRWNGQTWNHLDLTMTAN